LNSSIDKKTIDFTHIPNYNTYMGLGENCSPKDIGFKNNKENAYQNKNNILLIDDLIQPVP